MALRISAQTLAHLRTVGGGFLAMRRTAHCSHLVGLVAVLAISGAGGVRIDCSRDSDLVIMSRPQSKPFWRLFSRKTAERVIDSLGCGILVLRE